MYIYGIKLNGIVDGWMDGWMDGLIRNEIIVAIMDDNNIFFIIRAMPV